MLKKILLGLLVVCVVGGVGAFFWARSVLAGDGARIQLAAQLSKTLGEPVTVGSVTASIYPRITVKLEDVKIGDQGQISVASLDVGTDFRALLSKRIEHAAMHLNGAKITLPLPKFAGLQSSGSSSAADRSAPAANSGAPGVEIVSIDEVTLKGVDVVSGGHTLHGDIEIVPHGTKGATIKKLTLAADDTSVEITGEITDFAAPAGELTLKAGTLNGDRLLEFANRFSAGSGLVPAEAKAGAEAGAAAPAAPPSPVAPGTANITLTIAAERATMGSMAIQKLQAKALITGDTLSLEPLSFNVFGGKYDGTLSVGLGGSAPTFHWKAAMSNIDVAAATAFAGSPNTISGRFNGQIDLTGSGADAAAAMKTVQGNARLNISNGVVKNLGLLKTVVAATSMNMGAVTSAAGGSKDEPFTTLGGTIAIANGSATTNDLRFESPDLLLAAAGSSKLDGSAMNFTGKLQLSEALSKTAGGASVMHIAQDNGRLTLPATISGSAETPHVMIDASSMTKTAAKNVATQEASKLLEKKGLGSFLKR